MFDCVCMYIICRFQAFAVIWILYIFFWVFPGKYPKENIQYVYNLFYYCTSKHNEMSSTKKIPIHTHICIHKLVFVHACSTRTINWNSKLSVLTWLLDSSLFWVVLGGEPLLRRIPLWIVHFWKTLKNECKSMDNIQWLILPMYLVTTGTIFHKSESMRFLHISKFNVGSLLKYTTWSKCLWKVNRKCHPWNHIKENSNSVKVCHYEMCSNVGECCIQRVL